ncbi:MAG: hypothetical protein JRG94_19135 [Deltaproteobacteria bacterium]|nr:hypothetical protein [Deltaproteobacteria bacterium]
MAPTRCAMWAALGLLLLSSQVFSQVLPQVAFAAASDAKAQHPLVSIRADHMVIDLIMLGNELLVGTQSGRVDVYDRTTGDALAPLYFEPAASGEGFAPTVRSLAIAPGGAELAVVTSDGMLRRFALKLGAGAAEARLMSERKFPSLMVARYLDDRRILLGDMRGELALVDTQTGVELHRRQLDYDPIYAMELSPDRSLLALAFRSSRVQIVEPASGETQQVLKGHLDSVFDLEWISDHELATASKDKQLYVWDLRDSDPRPRSLYHGDHYITALGIDRIGGRLALPLDGFDVGLLTLRDQQIEQRLEGHTAPVQRLLFFDRGRQLISAGYDARVFVWELEPPQNVRRR